jgi:hypothetical protein
MNKILSELIDYVRISNLSLNFILFKFIRDIFLKYFRNPIFQNSLYCLFKIYLRIFLINLYRDQFYH